MKILLALSIVIITGCASTKQQQTSTMRELSESCISGAVVSAQRMSHGERLIFICR